MKRTKRMILATIVATVAITVSLMATAFAAPACPLKAAAAAPAKTCKKAALPTNVLGTNVNPADITTGKCPKTDAIKQMLEKLGCKLPAALPANVASGNCMKDGNCVMAACKAACGDKCTTGGCAKDNCLTKKCETGNCKKATACQR